MYSTKGYQTDFGAQGNFKTRYTYLTVTPQFEYIISNVVGISAGPFIGFKLYEGVKDSSGEWVSTASQENIKSTDMGLTGAVRVYFKGAYLKIAYDHGLTNISNIAYTDSNGQSIDSKSLTRNFQVGIGYMIDFDN